MYRGYGKALEVPLDYSGKCTAPTETKEELAAYRKEKLSIIDDFLVGKKKLKGEERKQFKKALDNIHSMRGIHNYFMHYLDEHM